MPIVNRCYRVTMLPELPTQVFESAYQTGTTSISTRREIRREFKFIGDQRLTKKKKKTVLMQSWGIIYN